MVKIEIKGINEAKAYLKLSGKKIDVNASAGINLATIYVQGKIKESIARGTNAPVTVDTGRFLNSVDVSTSKDEGVVFSEVPYAKFIEYGTSRMKSRPHFRNTAAKEKHKVEDIINKAIKNI